MKTPKEKAIELVDKYMFIYLEGGSIALYEVRQCALIAVDEIINGSDITSYSTQFDYWQQVKQEINNL